MKNIPPRSTIRWRPRPTSPVASLEDRLVTIRARGGVERLATACGEEIRLDRLVTVDGVDFGGGR